MDIMTLLIAFGLAMDSFSVSIANGLISKTFEIKKAFKISMFFGLAIMPVIGWLAGVYVADLISGFDHWVAFLLLVLIGFRMIYESLRNESKRLISSFSINVLLILSIATSIDALAVGLGLSLLKTSIIIPAIQIGVITFFLSFIGVYFGRRFGRFLKNRVEILGGLILITIGLKILIEHIGII